MQSAYHAIGLTTASTSDGKSVAPLGQPVDASVLEFTAPPQQGWVYVSAFVVVDATNGTVLSSSEDKYN